MSFVQLATGFQASLESEGLNPECLDPWSAWRSFKRFTRAASEADAEAVVVEVGPADPDDGGVHLRFIRYFGLVELDGEQAVLTDAEPQAAFQVECDLAYGPDSVYSSGAKVALADADYSSFDAFVAAVESHAAVQQLLNHEPRWSEVNWCEL